MMPGWIRPALAGGLALTAALLARPAAAQTSTPPPEERPPLQIGPVGVRPRLAITNVGVDNNVFNEAEHPKSDFTFTASPDVVFSLNPGRVHLTSTAGSDFVYFHTYTSERSVNRTLAARGEVDLTILRPFAAISTNHTSARANSELDVRGRHHPRTYEAGSSVRLSARTSAGFTIRRAREDYDNGTLFRGVDLADALNSSTTSYEVTLGVQLTTLTAVSLVTSEERVRFDRSPVRDSDTLRIAPTVTFSPLGLLNGSASVGYRRFTGRQSALADYSGLIATGTIGMSLMDRFRVETTFTRDVKYSYEQQLPYYLLTGGRGTVTVVLAGGFDVRVTGGRESMGYRAFAGLPSPAADRQTIYGSGVGYRLTDSAHVLVQVEAADRRSARDASRGYSNNRIFGSLNWGASFR